MDELNDCEVKVLKEIEVCELAVAVDETELEDGSTYELLDEELPGIVAFE